MTCLFRLRSNEQLLVSRVSSGGVVVGVAMGVVGSCRMVGMLVAMVVMVEEEEGEVVEVSVYFFTSLEQPAY